MIPGQVFGMAILAAAESGVASRNGRPRYEVRVRATLVGQFEVVAAAAREAVGRS